MRTEYQDVSQQLVVNENMLKLLFCICTVAASISTASATDVRQSAQAGADEGFALFEETYRVTGMSGLQDAVQECYTAQKARPSVEGIARCGAADRHAQAQDAAFSRTFGTPKSKFFVGAKPANRLKASMKALKLSGVEQKQVVTSVMGE